MKRHPMVAFWVLGFLLSWTVWIPLSMAGEGSSLPPFLQRFLHVLGAYGPAIAALVVTGLVGGVSGLQSLVGRLLVWRVSWRWYAVALFLPAAISVLTSLLYVLQGGHLPDYSNPPILRVASGSMQLMGWTMLGLGLLQNALGEELGWRGFVLQRLQSRHTPLFASISIGLLWVVWGLPLSWGRVLPEVRLWFYMVLVMGAVPAAIIITWLYNNTRGSLLLVLLLNAATKATDLFVTPSLTPGYMPVIAYWTVAATILAVWGVQGLAPKEAEASVEFPASGNPSFIAR